MKSNNVNDLERALLGAILSNSHLFHNIKGQLSKNDFFDKKHAILFQAINDVYEKGFNDIELAPIVNKLIEENNLDKIGGHDFLSQLMQEQALESNVNKLIKEIVSKADLRKISSKLDEVKKDIDKPNSSAEEILERVELDILSTARGMQVKEFVSSAEAIKMTYEQIEKKLKGEILSGIQTDLPALDKMTGGFQKGDLIILAARPSMGKTALALNMAVNAAKKNNVAFFSIEMPITQIFNRILSFTSYIDGSKIKEPKYMSDSEQKKMFLAMEKISQLNLYMDETAGIKLSELVWKAKRLHKNVGLDMIVIDYLQLITMGGDSSGDNRQNEVSVISRTLKKLARDLNVPVIALSQLSRKVEQRESKVPMMSDLRESGAIEQDADIIAFVYREDYYLTKEQKEKNENYDKEREKTQVIIAKHRNGATGEVDLMFQKSLGLFLEYEKGNK